MTSPPLLPLFPLGTVLFPGSALPLHVFEARYRRLVEVCLAADHPFGIVLIRQGWEVGPAAEPHDVGTTARIARVDRLSDGRSNLIVIGRDRFRINRLVPGTPYLQADVSYVTDDASVVDGEVVDLVRRRYVEYVDLLRSMTRQDKRETKPPSDLVELSYTVAANLQITREEQQLLLEASTADRLSLESQILAREMSVIGRLGAVVSRRSRASLGLSPN